MREYCWVFSQYKNSIIACCNNTYIKLIIDKMSSQDEKFENTDAGASMFEKTDTNRLKVGSLVMIKGFPCKVTDASTAKPGKHGSAKVILKGKDILTGKVYECTYHAGDMVDMPIVKRVEYQLLNLDDNTL